MNAFLEGVKVTKDPEIIKGINSGNPYVICDLLEKTRGGIYLKELEDAIIKTGDIVQIYEFLFLAVDKKIRGFDIRRFEDIILKSENPKLMCYCMGFVPGISIKNMLNGVIKSHNTKYLAMLQDNEEYASVLEQVNALYPAYSDIVEESKKFDFFPSSLAQYRHLQGDTNALIESVKKSRNPHFITELANYIEYLNEYKGGKFDITDLTTEQEELKDPMQAYEYLASVDVPDKSGLINAVIESGRVKFMKYVCEYVPELTEEEMTLLEEIIETIEPKVTEEQGKTREDGGR